MKNKLFKKATALLLSTLLILSSFPMTALAAEPEQNDDVYSVNMPASGSDTLDLTDKDNGFTFHVYDNGGASANYSSSCNGTLLITAPSGSILKIGGSVNSESGYDYLYIYDGSSTVPLGEEKYCGSNITVEEMYSTSEQLTIKFTSDSSVTDRGIDLTVTLTDASQFAKVSYSYAGNTIKSIIEKGTDVTLPSFANIFTAPQGSEFINWKCGDTSYSENEVVTVTESMTFEAVVEEPPVVLGDDESGWYAKMPTTGTVTADLSDKQDGFVLHVYDDGGADANYSNSCNGYMRIIAPANYVLTVSGSGRSESTRYDWLTIYDGDTSTVLGSEKYAGRPFTVPELKTTCNVLKLFFRSDSSDTYDGLDLTVTLVDYSNYSRVTYSYDGTANTTFVKNGTSIELSTFTSMFTLPERYHFTAWQSGGNDYSEGGSYTVNGDVTFEALVEEDPVIFEDGEGGYYAKLPRTGTLTADLSSRSAGDTLKVYDNGGKDAPYSYSCDGYLVIEAPQGYILSVNGTYSTYNSYDWIYLYDGDTSTQLGPKFMGYNKTMNDYYTTGNVLIVYLYSYYGDSNKGCDLNVTIVDPADLVTVSFDSGEGSGTMTPMKALPNARIVLPECGFTLPDKTYFDYYTDGTNTYGAGSVYTVTGDATLTAVYIEKIIATYKYGEQTAAAEFRKGTRIDLPYFTEYFTLPYRKEFYRWSSGGNEYYELQTYTFNEDVTFTAMLNDLPILIEKDDGSYYATLPKNEHVAADLTSGYSNGFTFMLYDNGNENGYYAYNCDGSLTFTAPDGYIFLLGGSIVTEQGGGDILSIFDSDMTTLLGGQSYSGNVTIDPVRSTSNTVKVRFVSDSIGTDPGFALTVRMIDASTLISVTFDAGEGSGTVDAMTQIAGEEFTLPDYGFNAPSGKIFNGYSDGTNTYWPGAVTFSESKTLTAQWVEATGITYSYGGSDKAIRYAKGSTVTLPEFASLFTLPSGTHFVGWKEKFSGDMYSAGDTYVADDPTVMTAVLEILYEDGNGGYYALMPVNNPNDELTLDISDKPVGFSFKLYDDGGPDNNYADSNDGVLIVKARENTVLTITGSGAVEYNYDYLRFNDGSNWSADVLGSSKNTDAFTIDEPLVTSGNYLYIYFHSDSSYNYDGFELTITVAALATVTYVFDDNTEVVAAQKDSTIQLADFDDLFTSYTKEFLYWQNGNDTYDEGDEYVVGEDVTFTAVTRLMPTATVDGNGAIVKAEIGGDGTITTIGPLSFPTGTSMPLPHANELFDFPENKYFGGWSYNDHVYAAGEEFTITEDITLTAIWRDATAWERLNEQLQTTSGTIRLTENVTADIGGLPLNVPSGVTAVIDLNGFTLDGTNAAVIDGSMIVVNGSLTLTDPTGNGTVTGGSIISYESGVFAPTDSVGGLFTATVTQSCRANDENYNYENFTYSVSWHTNLADAMSAAAERTEYEDSITLPEGMTFRWYLVPKVTLLRNVTIAEGETLTVNSSYGIDLDLNGHTFDVQGTFNGGTESWTYSEGEYIPTFDPTYVSIDSPVPGVFRSSGTIGVDLCPWSEDTYYFTGGTVSGYIGADGGIFHISGGHFTDFVMFNNGNNEANLEIILSGDAEFDELEHMIYANDGSPTIHMTINDNVRVREMEFSIMGDGVVDYPVLTINGGYFAEDPRTWRDTAGVGEDVVQIASVPEQYEDQSDWAADSTVYTWRVTPPIPVFSGHSLILGSDIGVNFYTQLDESILSDDGAYMLFTLPNGTTQKIYIKDAAAKDNRTDDTVIWTEELGGTTYYIFRCDVAAKEMTSEIKAQIISSDNKCVGQMTYTIKEYADYILDEQNGFDDNTKSLVRAMLNYGTSAQTLFGFNEGDQANAAMTDEEKAVAPLTDEELASLDKPGIQTASSIDGIDGVTYEGSQFVLLSKTTYRLRFSEGLDNYIVSVNGETADPTISGEYRIITIENISPDKLFDDIFITLTPKNGSGDAAKTVTFNPASYVRLALALPTTGVSDEESQANSNLIGTMTALYRYNQAAVAYTANNAD